MLIRSFQLTDLDAVITVFQDAVLHLGSQHYTAEQCQVWVSNAEDRAHFQENLSKGITLVAECNQEVAAFGQLYPDDHINYLYCASRFARQGCGSAIVQTLESRARDRQVQEIWTEASLVARPFFERQGFLVHEEEVVLRKGIGLKRFRMMKPLVQ